MTLSLLIPYNSPILIGLTILFGIIASITTLDIRLIQAKKSGALPVDEPGLPKWVSILYWIEWLTFGVIVYLNWKYAIIVFATKFLLKVFPVLEIVGNILMSPFIAKR